MDPLQSPRGTCSRPVHGESPNGAHPPSFAESQAGDS
jgi:hypothetical protein